MLKNQLIRLAYQKPELRPHLLPLLMKKAEDLPTVFEVSKHLKDFGVVNKTFTAEDLIGRRGPRGVTNETYGERSFIYVRCPSLETRRQCESYLESKGIEVQREYGGRSPIMEIPVEYFMGWHWDE